MFKCGISLNSAHVHVVVPHMEEVAAYNINYIYLNQFTSDEAGTPSSVSSGEAGSSSPILIVEQQSSLVCQLQG